jgi:hypothetical protein
LLLYCYFEVTRISKNHTFGKENHTTIRLKAKVKQMSVKLRKRENADGTTTLLLDIYHNGQRRYEFLKHLRLVKPANPADRAANKENEAQAKA